MLFQKVQPTHCKLDQDPGFWRERSWKLELVISENAPSKVYILEQLNLRACCLLCQTGINWIMGRLGKANVHSISAQPSQEGIK